MIRHIILSVLKAGRAALGRSLGLCKRLPVYPSVSLSVLILQVEQLRCYTIITGAKQRLLMEYGRQNRLFLAERC